MTQPAEPLSPAPSQAPQGGQVQVYNPSGALVSIPVSQLPDAQEQGYSVAPPQATEAPLGFDTLKASARGALRGATAGFADTFESGAENIIGKLIGKTGAGDRYAAESKRLETEHPTASTVGEMAGMAGGALAGEGLLAGAAGGVANVAGRGLAAVSRTGELAGSLVGRAGAGLASTGALGRAAVAGAELGARGAVEMGLYEGVKNLNEQMLGDAPLAAEKIFAAAADGAEGGAIFGAALGSGGSLIKSGAKGLAGIASDVASKNADKLQGLADEQRWKALNPTLAISKQANARVPGGTSTVGEVLGRYGITGNSIEEAAKVGGISEIGPRIDAAVEQVGQKLGAVTGASTATVPFAKIDDALQGVIAPLRKVAGREGIVRSLEDYRLSLADKLLPNANEMLTRRGAELSEEEFSALNNRVAAARDTPITIQDALFQRKGLDQLVYQESKSLDPKMRVQLLRDFRSKFEDLIVDSFDDAAKAAGNPNAKAELLGLKRDYQALSIAQDAAEASTSRMMTNRNLSLSDYMAGGTGSHIGGAIGSVFGPAGTAVGSAVGGAAGAALNKFGRERGNAIAASALDRVSKFGGKGRVVSKLADAGIAEGALAKEASLADAAGPTSPPPIATQASPVKAPEFADYLTPKTLEELGAAGKRGALASKGDLAAAGHNVFGDKVPSAEMWRNMWRVPDGYSVKIDDIGLPGRAGQLNPNAIMVEAKIQDAAGKDVGTMVREFSRDDGKLVVEHSELMLDPSVQGKGIGTSLSKSALESYHQLGVDRIELQAAQDVGPYAWARQGYKWNEGEAESMLDRATEFAKDKGLTPEQLQRLKEAILKEPKAVADLTEGGEKIGKEFLLQSGGWGGHLPVEDAHAAMLEKAAQFERAQAAIKIVNAQVEKAAKGIVEGAPRPEAISKARSSKAKVESGPKAETSLVSAYRKARKEVDAIQADPQALVRKASVGQRWLPSVSDQLGQTAVRAATFMTGATPTPIGSSVFGQQLPDRATDADMHMFLEKYQVAKDPMSVLRQFSRGNITQTKAMALQIVSPALFKQLQENAMAHVFSREQSGRPLPFEARQRLSLLLDIPTDPSQTPAMAKSLQSNIAPAEVPTDAPMGDMGKKKLELPDSLKESAYDTLGQR